MAQIKLRRMTDAARQTITFAAGEPCWTTDTKKLYVGDGTTAGGIAVDTTDGGASVTVENVLTSNSTTNALSAAQGKTLKTQVDTKANADLSNVTGTLPPSVVTQLKGADGKSAYQSWLDAGNTGTEQDFLAKLTGGPGGASSAIASESVNIHNKSLHHSGFHLITQDGRLLARGEGVYGHLGVGYNVGGVWGLETFMSPLFAPALSPGETVTKLRANNYQTFVITSAGRVYAAGWNPYNSCGIATSDNATGIFKLVTSLEGKGIVDIQVGQNRHDLGTSNGAWVNVALAADGKLYGAGSYQGAALTHKVMTDTSVAILDGFIALPLIPGKTIKRIWLLDRYRLFAETSDNLLYVRGLGYNSSGTGNSLGIGVNAPITAAGHYSWTVVTGLPSGYKVKDMSTNDGYNDTTLAYYRSSSLLLLENGEIYGCGSNSGYYTVGHANNVDLHTWTKVQVVPSATSAGIYGDYYGAGFAITAAKELYTWGCNAQGNCGVGNTTIVQTPVKPAASFQGKVAAASGNRNAYGHLRLVVADTDGNLWFAGFDYSYWTSSVYQNYVTTFKKIIIPPLLEGEYFTTLVQGGYDQYPKLFAYTNKGRMFAGGYASGIDFTSYRNVNWQPVDHYHYLTEVKI